jgi:hypothetical protein
MSGAPETARDQKADPQHREPREMLVEHLAPSSETYGMRGKDPVSSWHVERAATGESG